MTDFLLSQILMTVGLLFDLASFQFKQRLYLVLSLVVASIFISWHFFLLDHHTAGFMFAIAALRHMVSLHWRSRWTLVTFITIPLAFFFYSYSGYLSVISCLATLLMTFGSFAPSDKQLRILMISGASTWVIHNVLAMTPVGILTEFLYLGSGILSYYRFYIKDKHRST